MPAVFMCVDRRARYSMRDGLTGGVVIILAAAIFAGLELVARRQGLVVTSQFLHIAATPAAVTLSMPFWVLKGQSRRVQLAVVAATLAFAGLITAV